MRVYLSLLRGRGLQTQFDTYDALVGLLLPLRLENVLKRR